MLLPVVCKRPGVKNNFDEDFRRILRHCNGHAAAEMLSKVFLTGTASLKRRKNK
jgi:hypothetical protein